MADSLNTTTLSTISLLEARVLRIEHILNGSSPLAPSSAPSALTSLVDLQKRLAALLGRVRVYAELSKTYTAHPSLFLPPSAGDVPSDLSTDVLRATVLSYATSFPSVASALTAATADAPIPDAALSAQLAVLAPRMKGIEATQLAQEREIAELRRRSEMVLRGWYESQILRYGQFVADAEKRVEKVEQTTRRMERVRDLDVSFET